MSVKWTEDLSVGVDLIDDQHKMMFEKASELFEAGKERRAQEYIEPLIEFLDEYTKSILLMKKPIWKRSIILRLILKKNARPFYQSTGQVKKRFQGIRRQHPSCT